MNSDDTDISQCTPVNGQDEGRPFQKAGDINDDDF